MREEEGSPQPTYEVGFCKPPKSGQFKPGQSGNPSGRRKEHGPGVASIIGGALSEKITVTVNGKAKTMTKKEVVVEQQIAAMLKGNLKALRKLLKLRDYVQDEGEMETLVITMTELEAKATGDPKFVSGTEWPIYPHDK